MRISESRKHLALYCMAGFFVGILYANLLSRDYITSMGILNEYFLNQYTAADIQLEEYLWYVVRIRTLPLIALGVMGTTKARKAVAAGFLVWTGFSGGLLFTAAVMKMGIKGIILCMIALVPHFFFYIAGYFALLWYLYTYPETRWNLPKTGILLLIISVGVLLECYVNPIIMQMFVAAL